MDANAATAMMEPPAGTADGVLQGNSRTAHLANKRTGRPPGSRTRDPNERAIDWVALHWHEPDAEPPTKQARKLYDFAQQNLDRFLEMLERVRLLRGDRAPVKAGRAPRGVTAFPMARRVKRLLIPKVAEAHYFRFPQEVHQQLPERFAVVEFFSSAESPDYVLVIESDALGVVEPGGRIPEARLHVPPPPRDGKSAAAHYAMGSRKAGTRKLTLRDADQRMIYRIWSGMDKSQQLPEDFRIADVRYKKDGSIELICESNRFAPLRDGQPVPEMNKEAS